MKRTIFIFISLMLTFVATSVAQNNFTNAVKGGVEAVKEGFSPLTNLLVKRDSAATNGKKTKSNINEKIHTAFRVQSFA